MIRTVNIEMTVRTCPTQHVRGSTPSHPVKSDLVELTVALPALPNLRKFLQLRIGASMDVMAARTILPHGRMLENKGATLLCVAGVAQIGGIAGFKQLQGGAAVRIVATRAIHFPLSKGMVREAHLLGGLLLMAVLASIHSRGFGKQLAIGEIDRARMYAVTVGARQVSRFMGAPLPEELILSFVALEAGFIALRSRSCGAFGKPDNSFKRLPLRLRMFLAGAVTGLARHFLCGISRVLEKQTAHLRLSQILDNLFVTTSALLRPGIPRFLDLGGRRQQKGIEQEPG